MGTTVTGSLVRETGDGHSLQNSK